MMTRPHRAGRFCCAVLLVVALSSPLGSSPAIAQDEQPPSSPEVEEETATDDVPEAVRSLEERVRQLEEQLDAQRASEEAQQAGAPAEAQGDSTVAMTAGFDKDAYNPFFIRSEDKQFELNIGFYSQIRYTMNWRDDAPADEDDFTRDFAVQRSRIFFTGKYTEALDYQFRLNVNDSSEIDLHSAWGQWNFAPKWNVRFGLFGEAMSREDWANPQDVLGIDYSNNDFTFGIGSSIGAQVHFTDEKQRWWASVSNGAFGSQDTFGNLDSNDVLFTARWESQLVGDDWSNWSDLMGRPGRPKGVLLGLAGGYQLNEKNNDNPRHAVQAIGDLSFAGDGYQAMIAGTVQPLETRNDGWEYTAGILAQAGFFVAESVELYGRYDFISPGDRVGDLDDFNAFAVGINFLPFDWTNRWKFTFEGQYLAEGINDTIVEPATGLGWEPSDDSQWGLRFQAQVGF